VRDDPPVDQQEPTYIHESVSKITLNRSRDPALGLIEPAENLEKEHYQIKKICSSTKNQRNLNKLTLSVVGDCTAPKMKIEG
jgi:hypothetical protein